MTYLAILAILVIIFIGICITRPSPSKKDIWEIEYRPQFNKYYIKHNGCYIRYWHLYKNYRHEDCIGFAAGSNSEDGAKNIIEKVKVYWNMSDNYKIIKID